MTARVLHFPQDELLPVETAPLVDRLANALRDAWFERIIDQLLSAEAGERNPHWRTDIRQARIIVALCRAGNPDPLVSSSYEMYGVHPDLVFVAITAIRKAKLGNEYSDFYDENGNLIPQRLNIPDYDPTLDRKPRRRRPVAPTVWPQVRRLAPFRLIVSREEVKDGRTMYYKEQLQCGHVHVEFIYGDLASTRRRCRECLATKKIP